jgi:hypothetical protein
MFAPWPARADAIVLARALHDWPDDQAVQILRRAREALAPGGRVYVVELVRAEQGFGGALLDLHMLAVTGGRERTGKEYAGARGDRVRDPGSRSGEGAGEGRARGAKGGTEERGLGVMILGALPLAHRQPRPGR